MGAAREGLQGACDEIVAAEVDVTEASATTQADELTKNIEGVSTMDGSDDARTASIEQDVSSGAEGEPAPAAGVLEASAADEPSPAGTDAEDVCVARDNESFATTEATVAPATEEPYVEATSEIPLPGATVEAGDEPAALLSAGDVLEATPEASGVALVPAEEKGRAAPTIVQPEQDMTVDPVDEAAAVVDVAQDASVPDDVADSVAGDGAQASPGSVAAMVASLEEDTPPSVLEGDEAIPPALDGALSSAGEESLPAVSEEMPEVGDAPVDGEVAPVDDAPGPVEDAAAAGPTVDAAELEDALPEYKEVMATDSCAGRVVEESSASVSSQDVPVGADEVPTVQGTESVEVALEDADQDPVEVSYIPGFV